MGAFGQGPKNDNVRKSKRAKRKEEQTTRDNDQKMKIEQYG